MSEGDVELKQDLDAIPQGLKDTFVPLFETHLSRFLGMAQELEEDGSLENDPEFKKRMAVLEPEIQSISDQWRQAGGTDEQWNVLVPAIDYGRYYEVYPDTDNDAPDLSP